MGIPLIRGIAGFLKNNSPEIAVCNDNTIWISNMTSTCTCTQMDSRIRKEIHVQ